ncbi:uncharacterized protein LOC111705511 [Eurytemora carolleeae]|uniref:uncharacterized protein LOC111705511 n=1 Tax=Eurytemora carolleeae TaxID=1294199 RepID=UPI000C78F457|nr:uncharacterized protein LOC111705511 [Eurytemora carolleeae]|eukprot:XP_023333857.1 uncharacterized protein LOC111705511 [Eurytemora affinis]
MNNSSSPPLECPIPGPQDDALLMNLSLIMEGIIQLVICVLGMIGNMFSIFLLSRKELKNSFNQLLASLSTFDFIYLFTMALEALRILRSTIEGTENTSQILILITKSLQPDTDREMPTKTVQGGIIFFRENCPFNRIES